MPTKQQPRTPQELTSDVLDVSVTERGQFRSCRRRWGLSTLMNLAPNVPSPAMPLGTGAHLALEVLHRGGKMDKVLTAFQEWHKEEATKWEKDDAPPEALDELLEGYQTLAEVLQSYKKFDEVSPVQLGKVLAIEGALTATGKKVLGRTSITPPKGYPPVQIHPDSGRILVPIVDPITKEPLSGEPFLSSRIDLLTERATPKKGLWVVDHKTATSASGEEGVDFDDQITGYCYTVWRWTGKLPRGVVLNTLIKKGVKEPRMVQGKKKDEDLVLSSAKDQLTTADLYREAMKAEGMIGPGGTILSEKHEACLEALLARGWDPWFRRYEAVRNHFEIIDYERFLHQNYLEMAGGVGLPLDHPFFYPNPVTNPFGICQSCSVRRICRAMSDGSDWEGIIETEFHEGEDRKAT